MKNIFKSKTMWVNAVTAALGMVTYVVGMDILPASVVAVVTGLVVPIANVVLRFMTSEPVTIKKVK